MKQMKMNQGELTKLEGQSVMLEQQKMMIESANFDKNVIAAVGEGAKEVEKMNAAMDADAIADL